MTEASFCSACGAQFEGNDRYCANCGSGRYLVPVAVMGPKLGPVAADSALLDEAPNPFPGYYPATWSASGFILTDGADGLAIHVTGKAEAKAALKDLRLRNRSLTAERRVVRMESAEIKRQYRGAGRSRSMIGRGGGSFGKTVRAFEGLGRQIDASRRNKATDAVEGRINEYDRMIGAIDSIILQLEQQMLAAEST